MDAGCPSSPAIYGVIQALRSGPNGPQINSVQTGWIIKGEARKNLKKRFPGRFSDGRLREAHFRAQFLGVGFMLPNFTMGQT